MANSSRSYAPDSVTPPGRTLKRSLDSLGMKQSELASRMGKTEKFVSELINGKAPITPETALHLEHVLGTPSSFWNNRERAYRAYLARLGEQQQLESQLTWARCFPLSVMMRRSWIPSTSDRIAQAAELLDFFGIATPREWEAMWGPRLQATAFRQTRAFEADRCALSAWLRFGEIEARKVPCGEYSREAFRAALGAARRLTTEDPEVFEPELVKLCAEAGVAVVFTPDLPKTRVSAAVSWLSSEKALIQLGLRYKTDDHLWFSFFHEAVHVLKHAKKMLYLESEGLNDEVEVEADRLAADILIPRKEYREFASAGAFSSESVTRFAVAQGIAPGIVVGRLQHDGLLDYSRCNGLKRRFEWAADV